jgi:hypothetical protein
MSNIIEPKTELTHASTSEPLADTESQSTTSVKSVRQICVDQLRPGDWIQVQSAAAIGNAIDTDGTTDGLPFMPEMLEYCGQRFQIARFANKVCANVGNVEIREMQNVVVLKMNRCDGCFHGNCQMGCEFLWKLDWLEQPSSSVADSTSALPVQSSPSHVRKKLVQLASGTSNQVEVKSSGQFFRCQATELGAASRQSSPLHFDQYLVEHRTNGRSWISIARFIANLVFKKALRRSDHAAGPCKRTPVDALNLQAGDQVKVKSFEKIVETLDGRGCNRGLWFDLAEMKPFCGKTLTVTRRIDRIINEGSGELLEMKVPSVVLNETQCSGIHRRFCSRAMLHFWREVWLERVDS